MNQVMSPSTRFPGVNTRPLAIVCIAASLLGALSGVLLALVDPAVDDTRYSYPLSSNAFVAIQAWFTVQHLGLIAGVVAMNSPKLRESRAGKAGYWMALGGLALLTVTEVAAAFAADFDYSGAYVTLLDSSYGVSSTLAGVGLLMAGVVYARQRPTGGWWRFVPLATGVFVFVPMFPAMMAGFTAARLGITGWMLMFALLGWATSRRNDS